MSMRVFAVIILLAATSFSQTRSSQAKPTRPKAVAATPTPVAIADTPAPEKAPKWEEPSAFLGIPFGVGLASSVPACPEKMIGSSRFSDPMATRSPCYETITKNLLMIYHVKGFGDVFVTEVNGCVERIHAEFSALDAVEVLTGLSSKFGNPHRVSSKPVRTRMGVEYVEQEAFWEGNNMTISFDSLSSDVDHGSVSAYTKVYVKFAREEDGKKASSYKDAF